MKLQQLNEHCYVFTGAVNIGYCTRDGKGLLIDTGLDDSSIKKVEKILNQKGFPLDYCIITHAHTDHFGGASYLQKKLEIPLFAPSLEKSILEHPILEPIYLFNGAKPIGELRNKFLEGQAVNIDYEINTGNNTIGPFAFQAIHLPGHSYAQVGILIEDILYAADSYFGEDVLKKHIIPFIVDADQTISSLEKLFELKCKGAVPGHGEFEELFYHTVKQNISLHNERLHTLLSLVNESGAGVSFENLSKNFLNIHGVFAKNIGQWLLFRTSITAYLTSLERKKLIQFILKDNELMIVSA
ncbi:MBL fold metallo-hydrolase [Rossellomorea aquimaris]|uniref:MBL fold metallo-hydrolase n=1 Tax=Rossellomorea aquimaris TaxID=189382 RepID=UPI0007D0ACD6|nr:MBL fold metallo-hydrolase [Rossellomorea aquimaris]